MKPLRLFVILIAICLCSIGSTGQGSENVICSIVAFQQNKPKGINEITSTVTEATGKSWDALAMRMNGKEDLNSIYFFDRLHGWVGGRQALYKTENGGKTWESASIKIPEDSIVEDIFFTGALAGWIALRRAPISGDHRLDHFWLMQTKDGGLTWGLNYEGATQIQRVSFSSQQEGWFTTADYITSSHSIIRIFHTFDGGLHWVDVSSNFNEVRRADYRYLNDITVGIVPVGKRGATVLMSSGDIFKADDGEQNWRRLEVPFEFNPEGGFSRLGSANSDQLSVVGGRYPSHGKIGVKDRNNIWTVYNLNAFISDATFVTNKQVLACGLIPRSNLKYLKGTPYPPKRFGELEPGGVVLSSSDGGSNWNVIYRNDEKRERFSLITKLFAVDARHIWVIGNRGLVIRLEATQ
ncbi:MAG TPA: hypothetical protein VFC63_23765 [Blastocatellia bacterium]|nr:hypothetical protein [Blastocatellia bacterium]